MERAAAVAWWGLALAWMGCSGGVGLPDSSGPTFADVPRPSYVIDVPFPDHGPPQPRPPCAPGERRCANDVRCLDLMTDRANCGACSVACSSNEDCVAGSCTALPGSEVFCDGERVDLASDARHCGHCHLPCAADQACNGGSCSEARCPGALLRCGPARECIDARTDPTNCGACGVECTVSQQCIDGACTDRCAEGVTWCAALSRCADLRDEIGHCGACGHACEAGQVCADGVCTIPCGDGMVHCEGPVSACVDLQSNVSHCGACGAACPHGSLDVSRCVAGACEVGCIEGYVRCGGAGGRCVRLMEDREHCGACGHACLARDHCGAGACIGTGVRPISPLSGTRNMSQRPRFRWAASDDDRPVVVEVCARRDCSVVEGTHEVTAGDELRWPTSLSPGVHWWRVRGGTELVPGVAWEVVIPETDSPVPIVGTAIFDLNKDGVVDRVVCMACPTEGPRSFQIEYGASGEGETLMPSPFEEPPDSGVEPGGLASLHQTRYTAFGAAGDANGDGFVDLFVTQYHFDIGGYSRSMPDIVTVFHGSPTGVHADDPARDSFGRTHSSFVDQMGDLDGDGYADLGYFGQPDDAPHEATVLYGNPSGRYATTDREYLGLNWEPVVGDFDGDGINDVATTGNIARPAFPPFYRMGARGRRGGSFEFLPACGSTVWRDRAWSGYSAPHVEDVDHDGYPDLQVTFYLDSYLGSDRHTRMTWLGGPDGITAARCVVTPSMP